MLAMIGIVVAIVWLVMIPLRGSFIHLALLSSYLCVKGLVLAAFVVLYLSEFRPLASDRGDFYRPYNEKEEDVEAGELQYEPDAVFTPPAYSPSSRSSPSPNSTAYVAYVEE